VPSRKQEIRILSKYSGSYATKTRILFLRKHRRYRFKESKYSGSSAVKIRIIFFAESSALSIQRKLGFGARRKTSSENTIIELFSGFWSVPRTIRRSLHTQVLLLPYFVFQLPCLTLLRKFLIIRPCRLYERAQIRVPYLFFCG
jgi:hypothetical protein